MSTRAEDRGQGAGSLTFWFLLTAVAAAAIAQVFLAEVRLINPDTIQHMSAAANLLSGNGYSTNIVYYDPQYDVGSMPAAQTVWPPGYAWLLAAAQSIGMPAAGVAIGIVILAHGLVALLISLLARQIGVNPLLATGAALIWLLQALGWGVVLAAHTEAFFTFATVVSALFLVKWVRAGRSNLAWLFAAGAAASVAILTRYTGVFWAVAVGMWFLLDAIRMRNPRLLLSALVFGALPAATTIALLLRNFLLSGRLAGGQFETGEPVHVIDALRATYWAMRPLLGLSVDVPSSIVAVLLAVVAAAAVWAYRRKAPEGSRAIETFGAQAALELSFLYSATVCIFLFLSSLRVSAGFLLDRYFLPITPFIFLILAVTANELIDKARHSTRTARLALYILGTGVVLLPLAGHAWGLATWWPPIARHPAIEIVREGLSERTAGGSSVADILRSTQNERLAILAHHEHRVALLADGGFIYGLPVHQYSQEVWSNERVRELVVDREIALVIFFPPVFDPDSPENDNRQFFAGLAAGRIPSWLHPRYLSRRVHLYEVVPD